MGSLLVSYCKIKNNTVSINGKEIFRADENEELGAFLGGLYKYTGMSYPKFFKMDKLCKLGILATELMTRNIEGFDSFPKNEIALVFSNESSSLESDRLHASAIADKTNYFPSPSVFVYTLANIVIGEIAIKYKITGENAFFVSEQLDTHLLTVYTEILMNSGTEAAITGWVEVDGANFEAFIFLVQNSENINKNSIFKPLNQTSVLTIYNQTKWTH